MAYVYIHRRKDNNQIFYVGIGRIKNNKRSIQTKNRNILWQNIVNKSGFYAEVIEENISWDVAKEIEIKMINDLGRLDLKTGILSNMTDGGDGNNNFSKETKLKISNSLKGIKQSPETILKRKKSVKKAWQCPVLRKKQSIRSKELNRKGLIGTKGLESNKKGVPLSECQKEKISLSLKEHYSKNKSKRRIDLDKDSLDALICKYKKGVSIKVLMKYFNLSQNCLLRNLKENGIELRTRKTIDYNEFYKIYITDDRSQKEAAEILGCTVSNIQRIVKKHKIYKNENK